MCYKNVGDWLDPGPMDISTAFHSINGRLPTQKSNWRFLKRQQVGRQQWRVNWLEDGEVNKHGKLPLPPTIMVQWKNGCTAKMRFSYNLEVIFHWTMFFFGKGAHFVIKCQPACLSSEICCICSLQFFPKMQHVRKNKLQYHANPFTLYHSQSHSSKGLG